MTRRTMFVGGALCALGLVLACGTSKDSGGGSSGTSGASGGGGGGGGGLDLLCSSSKPCPSGEFCFNGICAYGCTNDGNCAANQYCDTAFSKTCQNRTGPAGCTKDAECASNQSCVSGLCSVVPQQSPTCKPPPGANDGCDTSSVCLAGKQGQANTCFTFPSCGQDGSCPIGATGAVCNEGYIQGKGRFCLPGMCKDAKNCPTGDGCIPVAQGGPVGQCSNGGTGQACDTTHACQSGLTCQGAPGFAGVCLPGLPGFDAGF